MMSYFKDISSRWLLAVIVHTILFQCSFDLWKKLEEGNVLEGLKGNRTEYDHGPAKRVILTVIGGLTADMYNLKGSNNELYKKLKSVGTNGVCLSSANDYLSGLKEIATGVMGIDAKTNAESVFSHVKVLYIGPPSGETFLHMHTSDIKSITFSSRKENRTIYPFPKALDKCVLRTAEGLFSNGKDFPGFVDENKLLVLIYLPGIDISNHLHGRISVYSEEELIIIMNSLNWLFGRIQKHYSDSKTAFILTSSHGFKTHINSENLSEVAVPFVTWGAGLCNSREHLSSRVTSYRTMSNIRTHYMTPLISFLLGVPIPINSFGIIPLYCLKNDELRAKAALSNARQMSDLLKEFEKRFGSGWAKYFSPLQPETLRNLLSISESSVSSMDYEKAIQASEDLIEMSIRGIHHYKEFKYRIMSGCLLLSLIAWIALTSGWVTKYIKITPLIQRELLPRPEPPQSSSDSPKPKQSCLNLLFKPKLVIDILGASLFLCALWGMAYSSVPLPVATSALLSIFLSYMLMRNIFEWAKLYKTNTYEPYRGSAAKPLVHTLFFIIFTMIMEYSFLLSVFVLAAVSFSCLTDLRRKPKPYPTFWTLTSLPFLMLLNFKLNVFNFPMLLIGALIWFTLCVLLLCFLKPVWLDWPLLLMGSLSILVIVFATFYWTPSTWLGFILASSPVTLVYFVPLIGSSRLSVRLSQVCFCLCIHVSLLALNFEIVGLFFIVVHVFSWLLNERFTGIEEFISTDIKPASVNTTINWSDGRCCIYYYAYVITSFLAIGNSTEINSWFNTWPLLLITSIESPFLILFMKSFPVVVLINVAINVIGRNNPSGYLAIKLVICANASFFHFLLKADYSSNVTLHFILLMSLLAEPISFLLLHSSLYSRLTKRNTNNPMTVEMEKKKSSEKVSQV